MPWVLLARIRAERKLANIGREKAILRDTFDVGMVQFLLFVQEYFPIGLKQMWTEQARQIPLVAKYSSVLPKVGSSARHVPLVTDRK